MKKAHRIHILLFIILMNVSSMFAQYGHWERLYPKNNPGERYGIELTPIGDQKVIFFGGHIAGEKIFTDTWIYDYKLNEWSQIICKNHPSGRSDYSLTRISKNKVLLFGGESDSLISNMGLYRNDFWIFDLDSMNWFKLNIDSSQHTDARIRHRASLFNDSLLVIFSGHSYKRDFNNDIILFNFKTHTISKNLQTNPFISPREHFNMDRIKDNLIYIFGGAFGAHLNDNIYIDSNLKTEIIKDIKNNCIPLASSGMVHIKNGFFLLFGGTADGIYYPDSWYDRTWIFDYYNKNWLLLNLNINPIGRLQPGVALIDSNTVLMYGGIFSAPDTTFLTETWIFKLDSLPTEVVETDNPVQLVSPNPAYDFIEITCKGEVTSPLQREIKIYNMLGEKQTTPSLRDTPPYQGGEKVRIDVSGLSTGMYFVRIGDRVGKFVKF